jgi:H+/Cl- antiporter ClcA
MIAIDVFHRLRAAQQRSAREQELLSGRNWILVCALVHLAALVRPVFLWFNVWQLHSPSLQQHLHPGINVAATLLTAALLLLFWWWARFAPFRAALAALIVFLLIQGGLAFLDPRQLLIGASIKALVTLGLIQAIRTGFHRHRAL